MTQFLDASSHLYNRVCPSVGRLVSPSVRRSAGHAFVTNGKIDSHVIIQSFHHHEDASLALWALFQMTSAHDELNLLDVSTRFM